MSIFQFRLTGAAGVADQAAGGNETGSHFTLLPAGADGVLDPAEARRKDDMVFSTDPEHEGN